jgi:hypothetical protein
LSNGRLSEVPQATKKPGKSSIPLYVCLRKTQGALHEEWLILAMAHTVSQLKRMLNIIQPAKLLTAHASAARCFRCKCLLTLPARHAMRDWGRSRYD